VCFLIKTLSALQFGERRPVAPPVASGSEPERTHGPATGIFWVWILTYGVVGAQMGWILRPFIGAPGAPFELFRPREGSFLQGIYHAIQHMV
jgi:hypothetical protein